MARTIAVGDIHGCYQAFNTLLEAITPTGEDRLVTLGDYVDRGPDSRAVIERLLELDGQCQLIALRGNHEWMMLRGLEDDERERDFWLTFGGQQTLDSYGGNIENIPPEHLEFLRQTRPFYETPSHIFLHANYEPELTLEQQTEAALMWTHIGWEVTPPHISGKTVVVGHTPQINGNILDAGHLICIDTYCYGGGWLTALDIDTRQVWQASSSGRLRTR